MQIVSNGDNLHVKANFSNGDNLCEMPNSVFWEKYDQYIICGISPETGKG